MLRLDELETLSRLAAGELSADKAEQIKSELQRRPELAVAFEQLLSLDQAWKELPPTLSPTELEALVARVPRPRQPFIQPTVAVVSGVAAILIAAMGVFFVTRNRHPQPHLVALTGSVTLDGHALAPPSQALPLPPGAVVRCGVESASIIENGEARILLARDSALVVSGVAPADFALQSGTLAASGPGIRLSAGDARFELTGRGVLSWEPEDDLLRVTDGMDTKQTRQSGFKWLRLPMAATAVAAGGITFLVLEGRGKVTSDSSAPIEVTAGQKWSSRDPRVTPIASSAALTTGAGAAQKSGPKANPTPSASPPSSTNPEALTRDQLLAEVKRLRSKNTALARRNDEIQKRLEESDPKTQARKENFYRADPDELRALAERGEMRLHPPSLGHTLDSDNFGVARDVGLSPDEAAKIRDIYERSGRRLHDGLVSLYVGMGADTNVANALETMALLQEIQSKTLPRDRDLAILSATRERGGLEQPASPDSGSALLRAYRLFYQEEDRILEELDAFLGPDRAEQFMNHPNTSHNTMSSATNPRLSRPNQ